MCQRSVRLPEAGGRRLERRLLDRILQCCQGHSPQLNLGGLGETLLHPELPDLLAAIKEASPAILTGMNTNGTLLTEEVFEWLCDGRLDYLAISLNAPSREDYLRLCGSDRYNEVCANARRFLARKGVGNKPLTTVHTFGIPAFKIANRSFVHRWQELADFAQVRDLGNWGGLVKTQRFGVSHARSLETGVCDRPWRSIAVDLDGRYHRCCAAFTVEKGFGSVWETPIGTYWNGAAMLCWRRSMAQAAIARGDICHGCSGRNIRSNSALEIEHYQAPLSFSPES